MHHQQLNLINTQKILVLVESLDVDDSSGTKGRVALLQNFVKAGYKVTALHYTQKDIQLDDIECVAVKERKSSGRFFMSRLQRYLYRWFKINIGDKVDSIWGFSFSWFNDASSMAAVLRKYDPAAYAMLWTFSKGNSYRSHAAVLQVAAWQKKWYAYVHDPYPQQLYPRPYNYVPRGYKKKRYFFREITLKAHRMVFPSLLLKDWMQSYYTAIRDKSLIVPHQIASLFSSERTLPSYFDSAKFNLLHGGNLLDLRDPKPLVDAYAIFLKAYPEAKKDSALFFLGKASAFSDYLKDQQQHIPQLYSSSGYVPFEQVYAMQQRAAVNIILEARSEISPFLPGKFAHCVAADAPIILVGSYYSECKRLLGPEYPLTFDFDAVEAISKAIGELYTKWKMDPQQLKLDRPDLQAYLSEPYLRELLDGELEKEDRL